MADDKALIAEHRTEDTYHTVRRYIVDAQRQVYSAVNSAMVLAYWNIGKTIYETCGENDRTAYGKQVLQYLADKLTVEFGKGYSVQNLRNMRQFYRAFPIRSTLCSELSWSHYRLLMRVGNETERAFYADEAVKSGWSVRQLERQINTMFYKRLLASRDKEGVSAEIQTTEPKPEYEMIIRDPYVLEFLNLPPNEHYYESELEQALNRAAPEKNIRIAIATGRSLFGVFFMLCSPYSPMILISARLLRLPSSS